MCELLGRKVADASWDECEIWNSCDTINSFIYGHDREVQREIWYKFEQLTKQLAMFWGISVISSQNQ